MRQEEEFGGCPVVVVVVRDAFASALAQRPVVVCLSTAGGAEG